MRKVPISTKDTSIKKLSLKQRLNHNGQGRTHSSSLPDITDFFSAGSGL